eukprot:TRINITY_DN2624_c0_g2_i1.p1 TRINITY_DN2624_c0_g2~~TRINITY_DN2624_c0_g2_i1.p1  ORF type:complete len:983 (-),score=210.82 TRINITY_DN2624_c0_g2_i1:156-3104(-)
MRIGIIIVLILSVLVMGVKMNMDGLLVYYGFDDGVGTNLTTALQGQCGSVPTPDVVPPVGSPVSSVWTTGYSGSGLLLTNRARLNAGQISVPSTSGLTIAMWFKPIALPVGDQLFEAGFKFIQKGIVPPDSPFFDMSLVRPAESTYDANGNPVVVFLDYTELTCGVLLEDTQDLNFAFPLQNQLAPRPGVWSHFACAFSLNAITSVATMCGYHNSTLIQCINSTGISLGQTPANDQIMQLGKPSTFRQEVSPNGTIDQVSVWTRALNQSEIQNVANLTLPTPPSITVVPYSSFGPLNQTDNGVYTVGFLDGLSFNLSLGDQVSAENIILTCQVTGGDRAVLAIPGSGVNLNNSVSGSNQTSFSWVPLPINTGLAIVSCCSGIGGEVSVFLSNDFAINVTATPPVISSAPSSPQLTAVDGSQFFSIPLFISGFPQPQVQWQRYQQIAASPSPSPMISPNANISTFNVSTNISASPAVNTSARIVTRQDPEPTSEFVDVPGANQAILTIPNIDSTYNGAVYRARISNAGGTIYSDNYTIAVTSNSKSSDRTGTIVGAVIGSIFGCLCLLLICAALVVLVLILLKRRGQDNYARGPTYEKPSNWDEVVYTNIENKNLKSKSKSYAELEELLVHNPSAGSSSDDESKPILSSAIMRSVAVNTSGEMARRLLFILESHDRAIDLVKSLVDEELDDVNAGDNTIFRQNSASMKVFSFYSKLIGLDYLWDTLAAPVNELNWRAKGDDQEEEQGSSSSGGNNTTALFDFSMEVDPNKMQDASDKTINTLELWLIAEKMLKAIMKSSDRVPDPITNVMAHTYETMAATERNGENPFTEKTIFITMGNFFWLRYVCPAIMSPQSVGILNEVAHPTAQRQLILLSKVLQNLANDTLPGVKEAYMEKLNEFISNNRGSLQKFYDKLIQQGKASNPKGKGVEVKEEAKNASLYYVHEWLYANLPDLESHIPEDEEGAAVLKKLKQILADLGKPTK